MKNKEYNKYENYDLIINVPVEINEKNQLMKFYSKNLKFPSYFGYNWDALYDCLCDLNWLESNSIAIIHDELPHLNPCNLDAYVHLLQDVQKFWKNASHKRVKIIWPYV